MKKKVVILIVIFILFFKFLFISNAIESFDNINKNFKLKIDDSLEQIFLKKKKLNNENKYNYLKKMYNYLDLYKSEINNNKKILLEYILYKISIEFDLSYINYLKEITKPYFMFSDISSHIKENLSIKEKQELIIFLKHVKNETEKLKQELVNIFKWDISEIKRKKMVIVLEKKVQNSFNKWRKIFLLFVKNKDKYKAYENYIIHSYFWKIHHYLLKEDQMLWWNWDDMDKDYKRRWLKKNIYKIKKYSLEEVKKHNIKNDCWTIIDNKVYNITPFFDHHMWWNRSLMDMCWKDWTTLFHRSHRVILYEVSSLLKRMYIGELENIK